MSGNVWEWCRIWYEDFSIIAVPDPSGPSSGSYRVLRGGSWYGLARCCRSAYRNDSDPSSRIIYDGFRVALASVQ